jgi:hypothetical protein
MKETGSERSPSADPDDKHACPFTVDNTLSIAEQSPHKMLLAGGQRV